MLDNPHCNQLICKNEMCDMSAEDIRWQQRFRNFLKAFALLEKAVLQFRYQGLSDLEEQGLIQRFEFTHELAWNVLKDYLEEVAGTPGLLGSKDCTREAFKRGLIEDGEVWMDMVKGRNLSSLVYDETTARKIVEDICAFFHPRLAVMHQRFQALYERP